MNLTPLFSAGIYEGRAACRQAERQAQLHPQDEWDGEGGGDAQAHLQEVWGGAGDQWLPTDCQVEGHIKGNVWDYWQ